MNLGTIERVAFQDLPAGFSDGLFQIDAFLHRGLVTSRQLALIRLRASICNTCAFCLDMHQNEKEGQTLDAQEQLSLAAWRTAPYFDTADRTVLRLTDAIVACVDEAEMAQAFDATVTTFGRDEACALSLAVAQIGAWNRLSKVFGFLPPRRS